MSEHTPQSALVLITEALEYVGLIEPADVQEPIRLMLRKTLEICSNNRFLLGLPVNYELMLAEALVQQHSQENQPVNNLEFPRLTKADKKSLLLLSKTEKFWTDDMTVRLYSGLRLSGAEVDNLISVLFPVKEPEVGDGVLIRGTISELNEGIALVKIYRGAWENMYVPIQAGALEHDERIVDAATPESSQGPGADSTGEA